MTAPAILDAGPAGRTAVEVVEQFEDGRALVQFAGDVERTMIVPVHCLTVNGEQLAPVDLIEVTDAQWPVLDALAQAWPEGLADVQHQAVNHIKPEPARERRAALCRKGLVAEHPDDAFPTAKGRAKVWRITQAGLQVHTRLKPAMGQHPHPH